MNGFTVKGVTTMPTYKLTPEQIQNINRMKRMTLNPAYGGTLTMPDESDKITAETKAIVKAGGMEIKLSLAEAFKL